MNAKTLATLLFCFAFTGFPLQLAHADVLSLGKPETRGSGCRNSSVVAVLSPDFSQLSILFDGYSVQTGDKQRVDRKDCDIIIPIHVPNGESFSVLQMDYRGYSSLPEGSGAILMVDYILGMLRGRPTHKLFKGPFDAPFTVSDSIPTKERSWIPCGKDLNMHIASSILVRSNPKGTQALMELDTLDVSSNLIYKIQRKACK